MSYPDPRHTDQPANAVRFALSVEEAAAAIGISPRLMGDLATNGDILSFRVGTRRLFAIDVLREWANAAARDFRAVAGTAPARAAEAA